MRKKTIVAFILAAVFLTGVALVTYAAVFGRVETRYYNDIGTGDINIRIDVYQRGDNDDDLIWIDGNDYKPAPSAPTEEVDQDGNPIDNADDPNKDGSEGNEGEGGEGEGEGEGESGPVVTWNGQKVLPGQTVSYITKIKNLAESAWIRIEPVYYAETNIDWFSDDNLIIAEAGTYKNQGNWEKHEEYYYYTEPVDTGKEVVFTTAFRVPSDLTNDTIPTQGFQIYLNADAVQSEHFTPIPQEDESAQTVFGDDPWFGTVIEECYHIAESDIHYHDGTYDVGEPKEQSFSVSFKDFAAGFVDVPQDFFSNWVKLMPGDTETGEVIVGNNYDSPVTIYFHVETVDENNPKFDRELLTALQIEIQSIDKYDNTTTIYSGPLYGATEPVALGRYEKNDESKIIYKVSFDTKYQNAYTLRDTETIWVFSTDIPYQMPAIGGIGTTIFTVGGAALILISVILTVIILIKRKGDGNK